MDFLAGKSVHLIPSSFDSNLLDVLEQDSNRQMLGPLLQMDFLCWFDEPSLDERFRQRMQLDD